MLLGIQLREGYSIKLGVFMLLYVGYIPQYQVFGKLRFQDILLSTPIYTLASPSRKYAAIGEDYLEGSPEPTPFTASSDN
jgi:hypothetical protein